MLRLAYCSLVVALAACPKQQTGTGTSHQQAGAGCPSGNGVFIASYATQDAGKGRSGWVVPLHAGPANGTPPDYAPLDANAAAAAGVPAPPAGTVWLATASGPPCRATLGGYYAARIEGSQPSVSYGVELEGCPAPSNPEEGGGILLVSEQSPGGCRFEAPQPAAARIGEMDAQKVWQRPAKATPIPPALAAIIPPKECKPPGCEMLWAFGEVKINNQTVAWSGAVNWLTVGAPAQQCSWPTERFSGFFIPGPDGKAVKITEGQSHPLVLSAVLADGSGPRVLLAEGPGEFATYDLAGGTAKLARAATWMLAPPDAWEAIDHIGPICDGADR